LAFFSTAISEIGCIHLSQLVASTIEVEVSGETLVDWHPIPIWKRPQLDSMKVAYTVEGTQSIAATLTVDCSPIRPGAE